MTENPFIKGSVEYDMYENREHLQKYSDEREKQKQTAPIVKIIMTGSNGSRFYEK